MGGMEVKRKHTVSLCMIVKNEEKFLTRCLKSMEGIVDEIVIIDTGSTDGTVEVAKSFNAKVDYFQWNQNFSDARNKSLSLATKDWIIVLDADEYLRLEDRDKLIEALNDFSYDGYIIKTLNFNGGDNNTSYITNLNQRIFKNNQNFMYRGAIHEQVVNVESQVMGQGFKIIDVGFYHSGYLDSVVKNKNKVNRNLSILEKVAEEEPDNMFTLFNLANEYSQKGDQEKALELYNRAYDLKKYGVGFMPKLVVFRLLCLMGLKRNEEALVAIKEGLSIYPDYTELVYYRGTLERQAGQITKAIESFETCLKMGKPRAEIEFQKMCYEFGPLYNLAEINQAQSEFEKAIQFYNKALAADSSKFQIVYAICDCLMSLNFESVAIYQMLAKYFNLSVVTNQVVFINLLIEKGFYQEAQTALLSCSELSTHHQLIFLRAKAEFYLGNYDLARELFLSYSNMGDIKGSQPYLFVSNILKPFELTFEWDSYYISLQHYLLEDTALTPPEAKDFIEILIRLMNEFNLIHKQEYFDKLTELVFQFQEYETRLNFARFFEQRGYLELARSLIFRTIQEQGDCCQEMAELLVRTYR